MKHNKVVTSLKSTAKKIGWLRPEFPAIPTEMTEN